ncbi:Phosphoenolpyruvate/pyruvate domain-containing protein [Terfezia boudieri ATCC MYA-4762]|uniref:Phosphoenolpyruvate/pyruvate domain-containing protein n=1 Tax=Terfezia boudieri ATCC MYA-4762 TaxID=1051890 RepID=A0A3N4MMB7_9PEZI|nr:Phosphoenolpyruvate/pyruvate domain-containing protein [Terfezia boudieri ATCC MYA-4762]
MQSHNHLLQALRTPRGPSFGVWQLLPGLNVSRSLCQAGRIDFKKKKQKKKDWILIDTEYGNIDDGAMHDAVSASPIVRVPTGEGWMVKHTFPPEWCALDAGAHGVMVPLINNAAEAAQVVSSSKFPPMGNVKEIAAVEGVDVLFVRPFDLGNLIRPHPILSEAIQRILDAANEAGKRAGIFCSYTHFNELGFHVISVVADVCTLGNYLSEGACYCTGGGCSGRDVGPITGSPLSVGTSSNTSLQTP